jgi:hypothetical protein
MLSAAQGSCSGGLVVLLPADPHPTVKWKSKVKWFHYQSTKLSMLCEGLMYLILKVPLDVVKGQFHPSCQGMHWVSEDQHCVEQSGNNMWLTLEMQTVQTPVILIFSVV